MAEKLEGKLGLPPERTPLFLGLPAPRAGLWRRCRCPLVVCRDPDDDLVLATALAAQADVIITGDKDLLTLKTHGGVRIRTPRAIYGCSDRIVLGRDERRIGVSAASPRRTS